MFKLKQQVYLNLPLFPSHLKFINIVYSYISLIHQFDPHSDEKGHTFVSKQLILFVFSFNPLNDVDRHHLKND